MSKHRLGRLGTARAKACPTGKRRYISRLDAEGALSRVQEIRAASSSADRVERRAYLCDQCQGWHLTSQEDKWQSPE